jgi:hypothetical protein
MGSVAHNLRSRIDSIQREYPGIVIGTFGDSAHMAEQSDHNLDACDVCHAIDVMIAAGTPTAERILAWLLSDPRDLEYVIHNTKIYERLNGWNPIDYDGSDPHTNHIHASGKHGGECWSNRTGVGYDKDAEKITPAPLEGDEMTPTQEAALTDCLNMLTALCNGAAQTTVHDKDGLVSLTGLYERIAAEVAKNPITITDAQITAIADAIAEQLSEIDHEMVVKAVRDGLSGTVLTPPA